MKCLIIGALAFNLAGCAVMEDRCLGEDEERCADEELTWSEKSERDRKTRYLPRERQEPPPLPKPPPSRD